MPTPPKYISAAARTGLEYYADGRAGDGLTDKTVREARDMADGKISDSKIVRANAWGSRHAVDLEAPKNSDASDPEFPGAGAVAHYLWGIDPLDPDPARAWFQRQAENIQEEESTNSQQMHTIGPIKYALIRPEHWSAAASRLDHLPSLLKIRANYHDDDDDETMTDAATDIYGDPLPYPTRYASTAIIPIKGVISSGLPSIYRMVGYADTAQISAWLAAALADPTVTQILLCIDSPGGMVTGTPELAAEVAAADLIKPVYAHTFGMIASAAYWIASQARAIYCTPSSEIGCIGVYQITYDQSKYLEANGIRATIFKSGDLKAAGHPDFPLTESQAAFLQAEIDALGALFRETVVSKRSTVDPDSMRGQSFLGTQAATLGLVAGLRKYLDLLTEITPIQPEPATVTV
jgi:signal peptide peptidase SppA